MKKLYFLLLTFIPLSGTAQIKQEIRKELDVKESGASNVVVVGDKGLVTYGFRNERGEPDVLEITSYSTDFEVLNSKDVVHPSRYLYSSNVLSFNKEYIHFVYLYKKMLHSITYSTKNYDVVEKKVAFTQNFTNYYLSTELNGKLFFIGKSQKEPTMLIFDPFTGEQTFVAIPGINKKRSVESVSPDNLRESLAVFYRDGKDIKNSTMHVFMIDTDGKIRTQPIELDKDPKYSIIDGTITWLNNNDFILAGTYGIKKTNLASGIYFSKWSGMSQEFITYHSFTEFENFFKYLPAKTQKKIERKKSKKESQGKEDFVTSLVAIHPVLDLKDSYMFVGEIYYPTYRTETYTTFVNGKAVTQTRQVFDGYQYSHAVVLGLDEDGSKLYDHCFPLYLTHKPFRVIKNLKITTKDDVTKLLFCTGTTIEAVFVDGADMSTVNYGKIAPEKEGDKVKWTGMTKSAYWYDNYYIIYGSQKIKNKENEVGDKKRVVFFLSKISYED